MILQKHIDSLVDNWINGNRSHVVQELKKLPVLDAVIAGITFAQVLGDSDLMQMVRILHEISDVFEVP